MKFNEKLQKLRKEKGLSQEALGEILDVSRQAISKWESGQSYPEMDKLIVLSELFGTTLDGLVKDGETETDNNQISQPFLITRGNFYEYKSNRTLFGLPLVHINIGRGVRRAKGIIAIGNIATGFVSLGMASIGLISFGIASLGLISVGCLTLGILLSIGAISVGTISIGAFAIGIFTIGALSIGMFSIGACSVASHIAIGDFARGHIAIGRNASGTKIIEIVEKNRLFIDVSREQVKNLITTEFPNMWNFIVELISGLFK